MKKVISLALLSVLFVACAGETETEEGKKKEEKGENAEKVKSDADAENTADKPQASGQDKFDQLAENFCKCKDQPEEEKQACYDEWLESFKGTQGSYNQGQTLGQKMAKCDPEGTMKMLPKLQKMQ